MFKYVCVEEGRGWGGGGGGGGDASAVAAMLPRFRAVLCFHEGGALKVVF